MSSENAPTPDNSNHFSEIERQYSSSVKKTEIVFGDEKKKISLLVTEPQSTNFMEKAKDAIKNLQDGQKQIIVTENGDVYEVKTTGYFSERSNADNLIDIAKSLPTTGNWNYETEKKVRQEYKGQSSDVDTLNLKYIGKYKDKLDPKKTAEEYLMFQLA